MGAVSGDVFLTVEYVCGTPRKGVSWSYRPAASSPSGLRTGLEGFVVSTGGGNFEVV